MQVPLPVPRLGVLLVLSVDITGTNLEWGILDKNGTLSTTWYGMNLTRLPRASMRARRGARNLQNGCALLRSAAVCGLLVTYRARRCTYVISSEGLSS